LSVSEIVLIKPDRVNVGDAAALRASAQTPSSVAFDSFVFPDEASQLMRLAAWRVQAVRSRLLAHDFERIF
jgi:hypothetical protein